MPTTNLSLPTPAAGDNPTAGVFAAPLTTLDALIGAWTDWSAALVVSQPSAVAKTVQVARYRLISKEVEFYFRCTATANGTATNAITISGFPVTPAYNTLEVCIGMGMRDLTDAAGDPGMLVNVAGSSNWNIRGATGIITAQWAIGDILAGWGKFEVA